MGWFSFCSPGAVGSSRATDEAWNGLVHNNQREVIESEASLRSQIQSKKNWAICFGVAAVVLGVITTIVSGRSEWAFNSDVKWLTGFTCAAAIITIGNLAQKSDLEKTLLQHYNHYEL